MALVLLLQNCIRVGSSLMKDLNLRFDHNAMPQPAFLLTMLVLNLASMV